MIWYYIELRPPSLGSFDRSREAASIHRRIASVAGLRGRGCRWPTTRRRNVARAGCNEKTATAEGVARVAGARETWKGAPCRKKGGKSHALTLTPFSRLSRFPLAFTPMTGARPSRWCFRRQFQTRRLNRFQNLPPETRQVGLRREKERHLESTRLPRELRDGRMR